MYCVPGFCVVEMGHNCFKLSPVKAIVLSNCADLNRSYKTSKNMSFLVL